MEILEKRINVIDSDLCFVLMPFRQEFDEIYEDTIKPTITEIGMKCIRADEIYNIGPVIGDIWKYIQMANLIVVELTGRNPNVLYELGLAHALNKRVIIITQRMDDVPFDLKHIRCITYLNTPRGIKKLKDTLIRTIKSLNKEISLPFELLLTFGGLGGEPGLFDNPRGIAVDKAGNIYVADKDNNRIQKFSKEGDLITLIGKENQLKQPRSIAIDQKGCIYVTEFKNERMQKFTEDGEFLCQFGNKDKSFPLSRPYGVEIGNLNHIYITTSSKIKKFDEDGNLITQWGESGREDSQFNNPLGISIDREENLYIADCNNHRIQRFNKKGEFLLKWGDKGDKSGKFRYPYDIAVYEDKIYVTDNHPYIQAFNREGNYLGKIESEHVSCLKGIAVNEDSNLYVVDVGSHQILKLKI